MVVTSDRSSPAVLSTELLTIASDAAKAGGTLLRSRGRGQYAGAGFGQRDIKLEEDRLSEGCIVEYLRARSNLPILSEESGWRFGKAAKAEPFWAVDPLDGSFNYYRGIPLCCTSVALCHGLQPVLGAVYDFNRDELFTGGPDFGVFVNGNPVPLAIARTEILATGFPVRGDHGEGAVCAIVAQTARFKKIRMLGTAALSLAWLAAGRIDGYEEHGIMLWDVAAGVALALGGGHKATLEGVSPETPLDVHVAPRIAFNSGLSER